MNKLVQTLHLSELMQKDDTVGVGIVRVYRRRGATSGQSTEMQMWKIK